MISFFRGLVCSVGLSPGKYSVGWFVMLLSDFVWVVNLFWGGACLCRLHLSGFVLLVVCVGSWFALGFGFGVLFLCVGLLVVLGWHNASSGFERLFGCTCGSLVVLGLTGLNFVSLGC